MLTRTKLILSVAIAVCLIVVIGCEGDAKEREKLQAEVDQAKEALADAQAEAQAEAQTAKLLQTQLDELKEENEQWELDKTNAELALRAAEVELNNLQDRIADLVAERDEAVSALLEAPPVAELKSFIEELQTANRQLIDKVTEEQDRAAGLESVIETLEERIAELEGN